MTEAPERSRGFLARLYDLSFHSYVTPTIIQIIYVLALILVAIFSVYFLARGFMPSEGLFGSSGPSAGSIILHIILTPIVFILGSIGARIYCEIIIATIRIAENTEYLRNRSAVNAAARRTSAVLASFLMLASCVLAGCGAAAGDARAAGPAGAAESSMNVLRDLRAHVRHIFVIYQENESFDHYFGTYPGADGLLAAARTPGFREWDPLLRRRIAPFRITAPDVADPDHSRTALLAKMDGGRMDRFVAAEEAADLRYGDAPVAARRTAELTMSYYDCDTIPFLWLYAKRFALFDRLFQAMTGPSTPGNIEIIAAQAGETQWARERASAVAADDEGPGEPVVDDLDPAFGPYAGRPPRRTQLDQRYATVLLTLSGRDAGRAHDDLAGVRKDVAYLARERRAPVSWEWYQEGYRANGAPERGYIAHHNAPQYFGYLRNNTVFWRHVHDVRALLQRLKAGTLPPESVAFIKGGSYNHFGWKPADRDPFVQRAFLGDDDHPGIGGSDRQLGEAFVATFVNAIAASRYWKDSAVIVVWDDSGGFYDHVPPPRFERCPDGHPCGDGPRIPLLVISPYARSGAVVHAQGDTTSVVRFLDALFALPPLASLPDERPYLPEGPRDANPAITDLLSAFDPARLAGTKPAIPASAAMIPAAVVGTFPPPMNCRTIGITPVRVPGALDHPPPGFVPYTRGR